MGGYCFIFAANLLITQILGRSTEPHFLNFRTYGLLKTKSKFWLGEYGQWIVLLWINHELSAMMPDGAGGKAGTNLDSIQTGSGAAFCLPGWAESPGAR